MNQNLGSVVTVRSVLPTARRVAAVLATVLLSAACSGSSSPTEPVQGITTDQIEGSSAALINGERGPAGLDQLWFDPVLSEVARRYSREMRDQGFVSHYDSSGVAVDGRLTSAGIRFSMAGENIATLGDSLDPAGEAHRGFMASAPHRANILGARYSSVGIGVATDGDQYWITQIFIRE